MTRRPRVGVLGGTFDPIHRGHLAAAAAAEDALDLDHVRLVPSARPPHRPDSPRASGYHRFEMAARAAAESARPGRAHWTVWDVELRRQGPSYTVDSLEALHGEGLRPQQIFFIIGADAFADIATWHRYPDVLDAASFAVVARPRTTLDALEQRLPELRARMIDPVDVASSTSPRIVLIAAPTPDVSSTEIRRRVARHEPIDDLVTPGVAAYIAAQALYQVPAVEA